jgi:hypothetical protein
MNATRPFRSSDLQFSSAFRSSRDILIFPGLTHPAQPPVSSIKLDRLDIRVTSRSEDCVMLLLGGVAVAATLLAFGA